MLVQNVLQLRQAEGLHLLCVAACGSAGCQSALEVRTASLCISATGPGGRIFALPPVWGMQARVLAPVAVPAAGLARLSTLSGADLRSSGGQRPWVLASAYPGTDSCVGGPWPLGIARSSEHSADGSFPCNVPDPILTQKRPCPVNVDLGPGMLLGSEQQTVLCCRNSATRPVAYTDALLASYLRLVCFSCPVPGQPVPERAEPWGNTLRRAHTLLWCCCHG